MDRLTGDQVIMLLLIHRGESTTHGMNLRTFATDVEVLRKRYLINVPAISEKVTLTPDGKALVETILNSTS